MPDSIVYHAIPVLSTKRKPTQNYSTGRKRQSINKKISLKINFLHMFNVRTSNNSNTYIFTCNFAVKIVSFRSVKFYLNILFLGWL
jgi:hypothetical protein